MRKGFLFFLVCAACGLGFISLAYWPRTSHTNAHNSPATGAGIDGPIQDGRLISDRADPQLPPPKRGRPYVLDESDRTLVPDGPVDEVVRNLLPLANAGDTHASLALYHKLRECFTVSRRDVSAKEIAMYQAMGAGAQFEEQTKARHQNCVTDGTADFASRGKWLERAAASGSLEAKLMYATDIDSFFPTTADMLRDPKALDEYKRKSVRYMSDLAANGNIDSMMWLARSYQNGIMLERNYVNSYAYYKAVDLSMPGIMPDGMLSSMRASLPADERLRGDELARSIYQRCCSQ